MIDYNFERLEQRQLLAGNVTAVMKGSTLVITGDANDNGVQIEETAEGAFSVSGPAFSANPTLTTVNGQSDPVGFAGVTKIVVDLGDGNDLLFVKGNGTTQLKQMSVKMGSGNDRFGSDVTFGLSAIQADKVVVDLGKGDDSGAIDNSTIGSLAFKGGDGSDEVFINNNTFLKKVSVNMGGGGDECRVFGNTFLSGMIFNGGKGTDALFENGNNKFPKFKGFE